MANVEGLKWKHGDGEVIPYAELLRACEEAATAAPLPATCRRPKGRAMEKKRKREREGEERGGGRRGERMICGPHKLLGLTIFFV
jgi:hypothetical protein